MRMIIGAIAPSGQVMAAFASTQPNAAFIPRPFEKLMSRKSVAYGMIDRV